VPNPSILILITPQGLYLIRVSYPYLVASLPGIIITPTLTLTPAPGSSQAPLALMSSYLEPSPFTTSSISRPRPMTGHSIYAT
jgi:hypothetical protein